ncbi:DedA family protein [Helicobacter magdeburgensis]|uniref:DedA family protein n=1 Tax=Helicobacter magdeburgensis TaxID=471858 RepID=A0A4U8SWX6_9HELI|nr:MULTISPECIES: DedA family protein [Helicobacter]TLD91416.1 DedA family protein [Helicobacter magdeburgensis]BDB64395.1 membrane protein [Helicobacter cinaedi]
MNLLQKSLAYIQHNPKRVFVWGLVFAVVVGLVVLYKQSGFSLEEFITQLWDRYVETWGYLILFCWGILEGELGLIFAGLAVHDGKMNLFLAIFIAGLGGFVGDQIYFYIGRFNRKTIQEEFTSQRRKFALAHLLLKKYGWSIIFIQRYMYGMRTIIPMSIGTTRYSALKFAIINLFSAWVWAAITIVLTWIFGEEIFIVLDWFKDHPYLLIPLAIVIGGGVWWYFNSQTKKVDKRIAKIQSELDSKAK